MPGCRALTHTLEPWRLDAMNYVYIELLGCAKNQVDAEVMLRHLEGTGNWAYTESPGNADLILVHTCGFIESAREESIGALLELKSAFPRTRIIMTGCLAQHYAREISDELTEADGLFGNRDLSLIAEAAEAAMLGNRPVTVPEEFHEPQVLRDRLFSYPGSAYVKLSEGCSHHCSYCAIPLIRGELRSRETRDVADEVRTLIDRGVKEINLIAQDLASFGTDQGESRFIPLLETLEGLSGDLSIRMLYIHPDSFPQELLDLVAQSQKILPYFDIPFQHASAAVLRSMGRRGDADAYLELISSIRQRLPDSVIRSTFMVGFPGEGEEEYEELLKFVSRAQADWAGCFIYSREEGTPAFGMRGEREHRRMLKQMKARKAALEQLQQEITVRRMENWVGRKLDVLIEEAIPGEDIAIGRAFLQAPEVDGSTVVLTRDGSPGEKVSCLITRCNGIDLEAVPLQASGSTR